MKQLLIAIAMLGLVAAESQASSMPAYPSKGTINGASYSFKAAADGDIIAYFVGKSADYTSEVGLIVNGGSPIFGLLNTVAVGTSKNFGAVKKGDTLEFVLELKAPPSVAGDTMYSTPSKNATYDGGTGLQHIYSAAYDGSDGAFPGIPAGTFIGFEDLPGPGLGDRDYNDHMFVFENTVILDPNIIVPEPATMTILGIGLAGMAGYRLRRRQSAAA